MSVAGGYAGQAAWRAYMLTASTPGPETCRIVALSEWKGQPEIHVRDLTQQTTQQNRH